MGENNNSLEERARKFLKESFNGKNNCLNLELLKGNMKEINYLVKEGYLSEKGNTVGSFHYEITNKGKFLI